MISMQYQGQFSAQPCDTSNITSWILVGRVRYRFDTAFHVLYSRGQDISQAFNANVLQCSVRSCPVLASVGISVVRALLALFLLATLSPILLALVFAFHMRNLGGIFHIDVLSAYPSTRARVHSLYNALLHKYFLPAATTLCLNTGLPILLSVLANGFIMAFSQTSKTSPKNCLIASSVCGLVGLFGILVLLDDEVPRLAVLVEGGTEV